MLNETELQEIKCITLTGENVVILAAHFDALLSTVRELQRQVQERDKALEVIADACRDNWDDWTQNGYDSPDPIEFARATGEIAVAALNKEKTP